MSDLQHAWPHEVVEAIDYRQEVAYREVADILDLTGPEDVFAACPSRSAGDCPRKSSRIFTATSLLQRSGKG